MATIGARVGLATRISLRAAVVAAQSPDQVAARRAIIRRWGMYGDDGRLRFCSHGGAHRPKVCYRTRDDAEAAEDEFRRSPGYHHGEPYQHGHHWHLREITCG